MAVRMLRIASRWTVVGPMPCGPTVFTIASAPCIAGRIDAGSSASVSRCLQSGSVTRAPTACSMALDLLGRVAGCFPRRETRQSCGQMLSGLLMELDDHNCWTIAEAVGHRGPHRLQHLLSRAVWDDQQVLDIASAWAAGHLDDGDAVLIVDEPLLSFRPACAVAHVRANSRWPAWTGRPSTTTPGPPGSGPA
jgi:hypothetical protein